MSAYSANTLRPITAFMTYTSPRKRVRDNPLSLLSTLTSLSLLRVSESSLACSQ